MMLFARLAAAGALVMTLAACGGHGGGSSPPVASSGSTPAPAAPTNFATVTVDAGPAVLDTGTQPTYAVDIAYVTVTVCAPGTSTCQTIDHVQLDTGSVGLRLAQGALSSALLAALPNQTDTAGDPVGECYSFVDGYTFGSVRQVDFQIGGEKVGNMPAQVIGDTGAFASVPSSCSTGGGKNIVTVQNLAANGILGIGTALTDCGTVCSSAGGYAAGIYYDCPSSGCASIVARAAATTAPFQQLPNPVAAMSVDNNGTLMSFPVVPAAGEASASGTLYFGIGTQANNGLGSATVLAASLSTDPQGGGFITAVYNGQSLPDSFIDSGSTQYLFVDSSITQCTSTDAKGFYCPTGSLTLNTTLQGGGGTTAAASLTLNNAETLFATTDSVLPGLGGDPSGLGFASDYANSFDFGLPFFFGRNVYTALEGRNAGGTVGPYYAF